MEEVVYMGFMLVLIWENRGNLDAVANNPEEFQVKKIKI